MHVDPHVTNLCDVCAWFVSFCSYKIQVNDFTSSWSDGTAFCAILHHYCPGMLDYSSHVDETKPLENLQLAFDTAHRKLGMKKLLDPEGLQYIIN